MSTVSIAGLKKEDVLAVLYNLAQPQGMGFMHYIPTPMESAEAKAILEQTDKFDYLQGRVMKVDLSGEEFYAGYYDCDNGKGAAQLAISQLRETGSINSDIIQEKHTAHVLKELQRAMG